MKKNILVTGSNGFIGKKLVTQLQEQGCDVYKYSYDVIEKDHFNKFDDKKINHVVHLAAKSFVPDSWRNPNLFYETNVLGTQNVLDFCNKNGVGITFLSSYMYGKPEYLPIDEKHKVETLNPYAHSKLLAEQLCGFYSKNFEVNTIILRLFNVYGQNQSEQFLIPSILKQIKEGDNVVVKDDTPKRDFVHIDDVIDAIILSINSNLKYEIFNIGSGKSYSVKQVVEMLLKANSSKLEYASLNQKRPNEILETRADISKAKALLDWEPKKSFEEGILEV